MHPGLLPRLITPEHARIVAETGGVIGVIREYPEVERWKTGLTEGGLSAEEAHKVTGGNAWRVLGEVLH